MACCLSLIFFACGHAAAATGTPAWTISTKSLSFGNVIVGQSLTKSITITSTGTAALTISSASVNIAGYTVSGATLPVTLNPNQTLTLNVTFAPITWGLKTDTLTVKTSAASNFTTYVSLSGTGSGTAAWTISTKSLAFGNVTVGQSLTKSVTITSTGTAALTISSASVSGTGYSVSGATFPVTLNPNQTLTLSVKFAPTATGSATGTLTVQTNRATNFTTSVSLSGTGTSSGGLTISPTSLSFGDVAIGSSATLPVKLTSSGTGSLTISAATIAGTGFSFSGATFPVTLSTGQAVTLNVKYAPTTGGAKTGTLTIVSTASTAVVNLSGTGTHRVSLSWQAPTNSPVPISSYNVYRATSGSSSYQLLGSTAALTYVDSNVQSGTTYTYYVQSVDSSGAQSAPSNIATVTVPSP